jgi:hypothetical protein
VELYLYRLGREGVSGSLGSSSSLKARPVFLPFFVASRIDNVMNEIGLNILLFSILFPNFFHPASSRACLSRGQDRWWQLANQRRHGATPGEGQRAASKILA